MDGDKRMLYSTQMEMKRIYQSFRSYAEAVKGGREVPGEHIGAQRRLKN